LSLSFHLVAITATDAIMPAEAAKSP
jgi:hypothetical protein